MIGCGAVAQSALPMIPRLIDIPWSHVTVVDLVDVSSRLKHYLDQGLKFHVEKVGVDNLEEVLARYLKAGDALIDLAYEIPTLKFLSWCRDHEVPLSHCPHSPPRSRSSLSTPPSSLMFRTLTRRPLGSLSSPYIRYSSTSHPSSSYLRAPP